MNLWGMVQLQPMKPSAFNCGRAAQNSSGFKWSLTYCASIPQARSAALCISGEREWATGSPITASRARRETNVRRFGPAVKISGGEEDGIGSHWC